jgi:hypothetical protein
VPGTRQQIARVRTVTIAFARRSDFSPFRLQKLRQFFPHDFFHGDACRTANQFAQMLMRIPVALGVVATMLRLLGRSRLWYGFSCGQA